MNNRQAVLTPLSRRSGWLPCGDIVCVGLALVVASPLWLYLRDAEVFRTVFFAGFAVSFLGLSLFYAKQAADLVREDERDPPAYLVRPGLLPSVVWLTLAVISSYLIAR